MPFRVDLKFLNHWIGRHRLLVWWILWVPLFLLVVGLSHHHLELSPGLLANDHLSLWYKVLNAAPLLLLFRLVALGLGLALLLVFLFFPVLRVGSEGVSWNLESYEEVAKLAGEAAGEEVELIVVQEVRRWQQIQNWLPVKPGPIQPSAFLGEFLQMLHDVFEKDALLLMVHQESGDFVLTHSFLPFLTDQVTPKDSRQIEYVFFLGGEEWLIAIRTGQFEGFSPLDQAFLTTVGSAFVHALTGMKLTAFFPNLPGFRAHPVNRPPDDGIR